MSVPQASTRLVDSSEAIEVLIGRLRGMPLTSPIARMLDELLDDPATSVDEVSHVIALDPSLAMRLLRMVNSAYFAAGEHVTEIGRAVRMVGFDAMHDVAEYGSLVRLFGMRVSDQPAINARLEGLWRHAVATATAARILSRRAGDKGEISAFAAGMLHDIGKTAFWLTLPVRYEQVVRVARAERASIAQAERETIGFDHAQLGRIMCVAWGQPTEISDAVWRHHSVRSGGIEDAFSHLAAIVHVADILARALGDGWWGDLIMPRLDPAASTALELKAGDAESLLESLSDEYPRVWAQLSSVFPSLTMGSQAAHES